MKKILTLILAAVLLCMAFAPLALADDEYTFTVRIYSGAQGEFSDGTTVTVIPGLKYGDRITFDPDSIVLNDGSKYYIKGIRESGKDNNTVDATSFVVTEDADYVVAYGIRGEMVKYTIRYVDENGKKLEEPSEYYGNIGDKPVVAFLHIEGYVPEDYNLTKTLSEKESENVFTFTYLKSESGGQGGEQVIVIEVPGGTVGGAQSYTGVRVQQATPGNSGSGENQPGTEENPTENVRDLDVPQAAPGNKDESSTPTNQEPGNNDPGKNNENHGGNNKWLLTGGLGLLGVAALGVLAYLFFRKKSED